MKTKALRILLFGAVLLALATSPTSAAPDLVPRRNSSPAENACVVLVLDESGSMEGNDPTFLRNTGAKLFVTLLDDGDQVGLVRFASDAVRLTPDLVTLYTPEDKQNLLTLLNDTAPGGYTDMKAALTEAAALLQNAHCQARTIVFLSDGHPELPNGLPADYTSQMLELGRTLNVPVIGIALTVEGESGLLYRLAGVTDPPGLVIPARTASDLLDAYLDALAHLKDRTVVGSGFTTVPGNASLSIDPGLSQYISRATFVVSKATNVDATLVAPGGALLQPDDPRINFTYTSDPRFAVYTVDAPAPGAWGFSLAGTGTVQARAILRSRLRIVMHQPAVYHPLSVSMPLAASLIEEQDDGTLTTLIGEATFAALITRPDGAQDSIDQLYDDGTHGDVLAGDGVFSNLYAKTDLAGEYQVTITGYKGLIPATRTIRVQAVPFPRIVILSPLEPRVELRGEPLILAMRLDGGAPPTLDSGEFVVQITDPNGAISNLPLTSAGDAYNAEFAPEHDGPYTVEFQPQNVSYKGVPYALAAECTVNVHLIPAISLADEYLEVGIVEVKELADGLSVKLAIISSSSQAEPVAFNLAGPPGLAIAEYAPGQVLGGASTIYLTLQGELAPGQYAGTLILSTRDGVDLADHDIPISLTVYQPSLSAKADSLDLGEIRADRVEDRHTVTLVVTSNSLQDETVTLTWDGSDGIHIDAESLTVPAGETAEIPLEVWGENLGEGVYSGQIKLGSREGVELTPSTLDVTFTVVPVPWLSRWGLPLAGGALGLIVLAIMTNNHLAGRSKPWGTLEPVKAPAGQHLPGSISLTAAAGFVRPSQVVIGSGASADVRLDGAARAAIKVTERAVMERIGRPAKPVKVKKLVNVVENLGNGVVKVNQVPVPKGQQSAPLRSGMKVVIGGYEFKYKE